tara:strand:- start:1790 stop:2392 length:603 start_codon:yes stop_codon:yes gene_type:complete
MLKKEFKHKDVKRMRNLITGNANSSSETQIGYKKKNIEYKEGDIWTENKKTWTIKNGIKQTISKLDSVRKEVFIPLCCPKCNKVMKNKLDKPNYRIHKKCYDCVIDFEGRLKHVPGRYEKYLKELEIKNKLSSLDQVEAFLTDVINTSKESYISEGGEIERWVGGIDTKKFSNNIKRSADKSRKKLEKELNESQQSKKSN